MVDQGLQLCLKEVTLHINEYELELNELSQVDVFNSRNYRAAKLYYNYSTKSLLV